MSLLTDTFDTADKYLAAYFMAQGMVLQGVGRDGHYVKFIFLTNKRTEQYLHDYETNGNVPVQTYRQMVERLNWKIRDFRREERRDDE